MGGGQVAKLLPDTAPLSTFRVITSSRQGLQSDKFTNTTDIVPLSCVFRAGRAGASTDHQSILFDIDKSTGEIKMGTTNAHWYKLGPSNIGGKLLSFHDIDCHPDTHFLLKGKKFNDIKSILQICVDAHQKLSPNVPLIGWDVALTKNHGMLLLEGNFSCNFFRGTFDLKEYIHLVSDYFKDLGSPDSKEKKCTNNIPM